jgi:predicted  nucleic acid-binding Zn-ribbon protein
MYEPLVPILDIQERDMQMLQLMRLKNSLKKKLKEIEGNKKGLQSQLRHKEKEIVDLKKNIRLSEGELNEIQTKFKKLEAQQHSIKKVEEFNALNHEMAQCERERVAKEQRLSEMYDYLANEEATLKSLSQSLESMVENNVSIESEIKDNIAKINTEGRTIKKERDNLLKGADPEVFSIYERLLQNKKDRVIVPIENRCCSGCHIMLTAQDENLVRKGERIVFCEHCSRIHYWQESQALEGTEVAPKQRRRKAAKV